MGQDLKKKTLGTSRVEKRLLDLYFRFMDYRDANPGAWITSVDIEEATAYVQEKIIHQYDLN